MRIWTIGALLVLVGLPLAVWADEPRVPLLIDCDLGSYLDDAFALGLVLASPEVDLRGVTTSGGDTETRAWMACRLLTAVDRRDVPVAFGRPPQPDGKVTAMYQYRYHPAVLFGRTAKPIADDACELLYRELKAKPGQITLLVLGPLTNVARLLEKHPDAQPWIKRIVAMGGALSVGQNGQPPLGPEWNIKTDIAAARRVLDAGVPVLLVPLDVTSKAGLSRQACQQLFAAQSPLTQQLQLLYQLADDETPVIHDAVAASACLDSGFFSWTGLRLEIDDAGVTRMGQGKANAQVATSILTEELLKRFTERITRFGKRTQPRELRNFAELVDRGGLPRRVHVFEDYETDIERRWWLAGKVEGPASRARPGAAADDQSPIKAPPGSQGLPDGRYCRGVLTLDFDDLQGDLQTLYTAVVFNPVPGPPMGEATRLAFHYRLDGTDTLRVQLYSLTSGYHRHLTLRGLPQGRWREAAVDMTAMRRPDGSGGPLAKDERIDDIQFYAAPTAGLAIDNVVLYDAAPAQEKRPFPRRLVFTGWFDTGKQGQEWPGDFEIVPHEPPRTWKAAKSVENKATGRPWIRVSLHGERPVGQKTSLRFQCHLAGSKSLDVILANSRSGKRVEKSLSDLATDSWTEQNLEFNTADLQAADELQFLLPAGASLLVDDVFLYEP